MVSLHKGKYIKFFKEGEMVITCDTTVGQAIIQKGMPAAEILDVAFCDSEKKCCASATLAIGYAASLRGKSKLELQVILDGLNELEDLDR